MDYTFHWYDKVEILGVPLWLVDKVGENESFTTLSGKDR